jgi:tetratricopeptide (TPR) repeat protein
MGGAAGGVAASRKAPRHCPCGGSRRVDQPRAGRRPPCRTTEQSPAGRIGDVAASPRPAAVNEEAAGCFKKAFELSANDHGGGTAGDYSGLGNALAQFGRWNEAAAAFDRALALDPTGADRWPLAAALHAADGDLEGYRRTCRGIPERFGDTDQPQTAERTANACLLLPDALDAADFDRVQKLAQRAVAGTEKDRFYRYVVLVKGLADYRAGRHADAVKWLQRFAPNPGGVHWDATAFAVLAMAQHGLGRAEEAQASLAKAKAILAKMPDPAKGQPFEAGNWHDWLHAQTLCREADALLTKE